MKELRPKWISLAKSSIIKNNLIGGMSGGSQNLCNGWFAALTYSVIYDFILCTYSIPFGKRNGSRLYQELCKHLYPFIENTPYDKSCWWQAWQDNRMVIDNYIQWIKSIRYFDQVKKLRDHIYEASNKFEHARFIPARDIANLIQV